MNERKRSEEIDKWNAARMTPATPKPRAGEQFRRTPDVIAQLEADNAALRERERELVDALQALVKSAAASNIAGQSLYAAPVVERARALLANHGR